MMKKLLFILAAMLAAQAALAQEQDKKFYVFGQIGSASVDIDKANDDAALIGAGAVGLQSSVNQSAGAVLIGAGYMFNPRASVELGFLKANDFTYKATFAQGTATDNFSGSGVGVNLVGYLPLGERISAYGKLGIWSMSVDETATINAAGFGQATASSSNTTPMLGLGVDFKVFDQLSLRAEYDYFNKIGDDSTIGSSKLSFLSAGVALHF